MSKVATYLQGHIAGEVSTRVDVRKKYADGSSVIQRTPELVIAPRTTNDVRKVARFAWQLAEKGHSLGITVRGAGTDPTGGANGEGMMVLTRPHLNKIFEYDQKQQLLRLQPGATVEAVNTALGLHQSRLAVHASSAAATLGGLVGFGDMQKRGGKQWIDRLEVVLDNGDVIQTGQISKREFSRRRGMQGREGDIYRGIDTILEDHADLIAKLQEDENRDRSGYAGICDVESRNGSIDLTPLFVGSQGTLGIVTEMIVRGEYAPEACGYVAALFSSGEEARDAVDELDRLNPTHMDYIDGRYVAEAVKQGKVYKWLKDVSPADLATSTLVIVRFDVFKSKKRLQSLKKATKLLSQFECAYTTSETDDLDAMIDVVEYSAAPAAHADHGAPVLVPSFYVPAERFEDFMKELASLETQLHLDLPFYGEMVNERFTVRPTLSLQKTADKQKLLKLIDSLSTLVTGYDGVLISNGAEGSLLSRFVRAQWEPEYEKMMDEIKQVFDPHGVLNPGVKQTVELRTLAGHLRHDNHSLL
ncbi:MAG TPA: FAD-binding oxidoreductase [Patescibacteria group bacterium]|nr:FAD-binding oxidoreductase [Patescibacteria group bacterium]